MTKSSSRGSSLLTVLVVALPLMVVAGAWIAGKEIGSRGVAFFDRGSSVFAALDRFAHSAKSLDRKRMAEFFAPDYRGESLGLEDFKLTDSKDGVQRFAMHSDGA